MAAAVGCCTATRKREHKEMKHWIMEREGGKELCIYASSAQEVVGYIKITE